MSRDVFQTTNGLARRANPTCGRPGLRCPVQTIHAHARLPPVRPAQADELLDAIRRYYAEDGIAFDPALVGPALARLLAEPALGRAFFLADDTGARAGYTVFTFGFDHEAGGPLATVTDLFVEPTHRRRGFARAALTFVAETCRALGVRGLELQVETHNAAGQALYRSFGFQAHRRIPMFLPLSGG